MVGSTERILKGLEGIQSRVLCEVGIPNEDGKGYRRLPITGAIVSGTIEGLEQRIATLECELDATLKVCSEHEQHLVDAEALLNNWIDCDDSPDPDGMLMIVQDETRAYLAERGK